MALDRSMVTKTAGLVEEVLSKQRSCLLIKISGVFTSGICPFLELPFWNDNKIRSNICSQRVNPDRMATLVSGMEAPVSITELISRLPQIGLNYSQEDSYCQYRGKKSDLSVLAFRAIKGNKPLPKYMLERLDGRIFNDCHIEGAVYSGKKDDVVRRIDVIELGQPMFAHVAYGRDARLLATPTGYEIDW